MDVTYYTNCFTANKNIFENLFKSVVDDQIYWKQKPDKWCPLEIICHLLDEECEDFKVRIQHVFNSPHLPPPPVNPVKWVSERNYIEQNYTSKLNDFIIERSKSVVWLSQLEDSPWENAYNHPKFGPMSARYFLANWLAHDYLHIKQMIRLQYDFLNSKTNLDLNYAGKWV